MKSEKDTKEELLKELELLKQQTRDMEESKGKLRRTDETLKKSELWFQQMVENIKLVAVVLDRHGRITFCNNFLLELTGWQRHEVLGQDWFDTLIPEEERDKERQVFLETIRSGEWPDHSSSVIRILSGELRLISWSNTVLRNAEGNILHIASIGDDITEQKRMEETIQYQAYHDFLTGLPNRALFMDRLARALTHARRNKKMLAVMFLDLDRFKNINDSLGHGAGDQLLKEVGARMKACLREEDTVARLGGDEFSILMPEISQAEDPAKIAKKILTTLQMPFTIKDQEVSISGSIGITTYPGDSENADVLLKNADIALYSAKEKGRNNYQFYNTAMNVRSLERIILENSLRRTLEQGELVVHYIPEVSIGPRQIMCAEALVRWHHPQLGLLTPAQFLPVAQESGLISVIDEWVLRAACKQNREWQGSGFQPLCVTVNLSARRFQQQNLVEMVSKVLQDTGLHPRFLELEITESTVMADFDLAVSVLSQLAEKGVRFSIDDFGTGWSSVSLLKKLPIRKLKIDRSFIRGLTTNPDDRAVVNAVIAMAHSLKMHVVAEGVENEEQVAFLHSSHCDGIQGYLVSEPLPADKFEEWLRQL